MDADDKNSGRNIAALCALFLHCYPFRSLVYILSYIYDTVNLFLYKIAEAPPVS